MTKKLILDACCSVKAMWYNKNHPNAVYIDIRKEPSGFLGYGRKEALQPDYVMDFRKMTFKDKSFKLVVFEPPHLRSLGKNSYFRKKFGCLVAQTWQCDLQKGEVESSLYDAKGNTIMDKVEGLHQKVDTITSELFSDDIPKNVTIEGLEKAGYNVKVEKKKGGKRGS